MTNDIGITGFGNAGHIHLPAVETLESTRLAAVCDVDESAIADIEGPRTYTDHARMLAVEDLDLVLVCTPPTVRSSLLESAGEHGVPVLVEKPTATGVDELEELIRIRDEFGIPVCATRNVAFFPVLQQVRKQVADGAIGSVTAVEFTWAERRPLSGADMGQESWVSEFETGVLAEMVSHPVYCALEFTGDLAGEVSVSRYRYTDTEWPDGVSITARDVRDAALSVTVLTQSHEQRRLAVHGTDGTVTVRLDRDSFEIDYRSGPTVTYDEFPEPGSKHWSRGHLHLLDEFLSRLELGSDRAPVPLEEERDVMRVFEAVESGKTSSP